ISTQYNIIEELYIKGQIGIDFDYFKALDVTPTGSLTNVRGSMSESKRSFYETNLSLIMGYKNTFGPISVNVFGGGNQMRQQTESSNFTSGNFNVPFNYFIRNGLSPNFSQGFGDHAINSLFLSADIGLYQYLFLTLNGRQDWFSTLSMDNNNLFYPSAGLSFVFSDALTSKPSWLSLGKIRASWAQVGGGAPDPYALMLSYAAQ